MNTATIRRAVARRRPLALSVMAVTGLTLASGAQSAGTAPLVGNYQTSVRITAQTQNGNAPPVGFTAVGIWRFARHCSSGTCTETLFRPSIIPGRTTVFEYSLHPVAGGRYSGTVNTPVVCYSAGPPPIKVLPNGSVVDHEVITIQPTRTSAGKVVAYDGTWVLTGAPSQWGRADGCTVNEYQEASLSSPAVPQ
jgi:hypothetical protein